MSGRAASGVHPAARADEHSSRFWQLLSIHLDVWQVVRMASSLQPRRIGAADSKTRARLVDAAEQLLLEEGYAAVTSRRVGARAELKPQLVHYYFRTMDDLFTEVFRRRAEENLARFQRAMAADPSLRTLWRLNADPRGSAFSIEFVALANHRKTIRAEIARYAERFRAAQVQALTAALAADGITPDQLPPIVGLLLMTGLSQVLALEDALGVTAGHAAAVEFVRDVIDRLEPRTSNLGAGVSDRGCTDVCGPDARVTLPV
jgi:AcrR family transcriptional regulator